MTALAPGARDPIARRADRHPGRTAVCRPAGDECLSFGALDRRVAALAEALPTADRIAICLAEPLAAVVAIGAIWRAGASVVLCDPEAPTDALRERVAATDPALVLADRPAGLALDRARPIAAVDDGGTVEGDREHRAAWSADREAVVAFTSGTTGEPEPVPLATRTLAASVDGWSERIGTAAEWWVDPLAIHHMGGFMPIVRAIGLGTTVVIERAPDPDRLAALLQTATGVSLVPTQLAALLEAGRAPPEGLEAVLVGGAAISPSLRERALDRGWPLWPTYGTTETASGIAIARPAALEAHPETVGRPLATIAVTICDPETGEPRPAGETGEIVVSGPSVTPGPLAGDRWIEAGLRTGDRGRLVEGYLFVEGRLDDRIVTGGETVDPRAIERALCEQPAVEAAAVVGRPDDRWGERVEAVVATDETIDREALAALARERLRPPERPKAYAIVENLPRTASGTVDRAALRDRLDRAD